MAGTRGLTPVFPTPQCRLPALPLPEAAAACGAQGLPGAAAAARPPADPLSGAHAGRAPARAPAPAPNRCGPRRGAYPAAPPPGVGRGREGPGGVAGVGLAAPDTPASLPTHRSCSPRHRAPWSSPPTCPPWAATPSCCTATSRPTPPSLWRSSSTGVVCGRVSRGADPGRGGSRGLIHTAHRVIPHTTWMGRVPGPQLTGALARCPLPGCDRAVCPILPSALTCGAPGPAVCGRPCPSHLFTPSCARCGTRVRARLLHSALTSPGTFLHLVGPRV